MQKQLLRYILALGILFVSCKKKNDFIDASNASEVNKFKEYIIEVSPGIISVYEEVVVVLQNPVQGWSNNQELSSKIMTVSPKVKGKVLALDNHTLVFRPDKAFKPDTVYTFTLRLDKFIQEIPDSLDEFVFQVKTIKQQFTINTRNLQSYNKTWQSLSGVMTLSDMLEPEIAQQLITATQGEQKLSVKLENNKNKSRQFNFIIDSIQRFTDDSEIQIKWSGKQFDIDSEGSRSMTISGKNNFKVQSIDVVNTEDQYVTINFTDPLAKNQNFDGLISIEGAKSLKYTVNGQVLKVYPQQELKGTLRINIFQGITSIDDYQMKQDYSNNIAFDQPKPEVRLLQNGTILPNTNNLKFNFEAVNLRAVEVKVIKIFENNMLQFLQYNNLKSTSDLRAVGRPVAQKIINLQENKALSLGKWNAFAIDLQKIIKPSPGAMYRVELTYKKAYSLYTCDGETPVQEPIEELIENYDEAPLASSLWDSSEYYNEQNGDYDWEQRNNPCHTSYYRNKKIQSNLLASNLGVVVKKGLNHSYFVAVNDIISTAPVAAAKVSFYNYQQQLMGSKTTDEVGIAIFDAAYPAFFAVIEAFKQKTYVKLNDGNSLSVSKFDVAGVKLQKGIKGYLYGERGVWRPGDTLFLSFMLNDNANKLPEKHPIKFELKDPYGKVVRQQISSKNANNLYRFTTVTDPEAPTGNWQAKVHVGGASFAKNIRIETIKPNRLKIKTTFDTEVLESGKPISGNLEVLWLHGAIAKNLKTDMSARMSAMSTTFKSFPGYTFDDPARRFNMDTQQVYQGTLNTEGKTQFSFNPKLEKQAAGMLKASFMTKVYENGGDFSTDVISKTYSPYKTYVGVLTPKGDKARGMLLTDTKHRFEVATVDEQGYPKSVKNLKVTIYKVNWRWWWDTTEDNLSSYNGGSYNSAVFSKTIATNAKGLAAFQFELKYPEWGRYLVRIEDPKGGHATGKAIYIDWPGWAGKSKKNDPSAATMLHFSTDKKTYNVGETATVTFPSSAQGRALLTIENGTEVLTSQWITPQEGETKVTIPIEAEFTPNVYIHITLLQPHSNTANDLPIRLYGVTPITVENPATRISPQLVMPNVLAPESTVKVKVTETNGKPMTYTLAMVDEGLLDLTRFKTPDPWSTFYAREALGVKTWDIYDDVLGAYGGTINQIFAIGGDQEAGGSKAKKANRFKPMVIYLGPFELEAGKTATHTVTIPKYVGSVRTMVVASDVSKGAYGLAEKTTPVRKPLMVLSSVPRKMTPGEKVTIPVTVFAMENKIKNVTVALKPHKSIKILGETSKKINFSQPDEQIVYFEVEVLDTTEIGAIDVTARGHGEKASYQTPIAITNPNPVTTELQAIVLEPNSEQEINFASFGVKGSNTAVLEFSSLPPMNFTGRLQYLIQYPHGCVEQTTSSAFPQLHLATLFDVSVQEQQKITQNIKAAIQRLASFMLPNGGLGYWPGNNNADDWGTSYAGHFLLEAEKKGYVLPISFKTNWVRYQQQQSREWRSTAHNHLTQAYRLYTLALSGNADLSSMNRLRSVRDLNNEAKWRLAAAYALVGQQDAAKKLQQDANLDFRPYKGNYHSYGSVDRNRAMALETLVLLEKKSKANEVASQLAKALTSRRWMSTQTTAYSLLSMAKYAELIGGKGVQASFNMNQSGSVKVNTTKAITKHAISKINNNNTVTLKNTKDNTIFVQLMTQGILPVGQEKIAQRGLKVIVDYKNRDGKILNITQLVQGTDFVAEVTVTNTKGVLLKDVALSEILPSGWEVVNTRFTDFGSFKANAATHTDIRDDRVNFYFDLKERESKSFTILLSASYLGRYYLPGIQAEAMYDNDYFVRTRGRWVEVVK